MKRILMLALFSVVACAGTSPTRSAPEVPAAPPPPIQVQGPGKKLASIDPKTLVVTYEKGADPKVFAQEMVKAWAQAQANFEQCQAVVKSTMDKEKK